MVSLTEEMILNEDFREKFPGLRRFRVEYGFECSCPEGTIYWPGCMDEDLLEEFVSSIKFECNCYKGV